MSNNFRCEKLVSGQWSYTFISLKQTAKKSTEWEEVVKKCKEQRFAVAAIILWFSGFLNFFGEYNSLGMNWNVGKVERHCCQACKLFVECEFTRVKKNCVIFTTTNIASSTSLVSSERRPCARTFPVFFWNASEPIFGYHPFTRHTSFHSAEIPFHPD